MEIMFFGMARDFQDNKMKIITEIKEANSLLEFYSGATFQIVMFSTSLKRMALRLARPNLQEVLYIIGIGCESINGRFNFTCTTLNINQIENEECRTIISDVSEGFSLVTSGGFSLAQGIESEFGTSFDNFLLDKE
jgi:hypothetical protein